MFMKQQIEEIVQKRIEHLEQQRAELLDALKEVLPIATKSNSLSVNAYNKSARAITRAAAQMQLNKETA